MAKSDTPSLADDLLTGAKEIAGFLGPSWPERRVYYAAEKEYLPIKRVGTTLIARRSELSAALSATEAA